MKTIMTMVFSVAAAVALADTITWTGNGDGVSWTDTANWVATSTGEAPASVPLSAANSGDQVVISGEGVTVNYNGGDPNIGENESITISGGAVLTQTVASWWHGEGGQVVIDGGTFDTGACSGTHVWASFSVMNGGKLIARTAIPGANVTLDASSSYEMMSPNNYTYTGTEKFSAFTATSQGAELQFNGSILAVDLDITWTCRLISATALSLVWNEGSLVLWDTTFGGYYNGGGTIDIAQGWTGSFTFAYAPSTVFASCFQNKITYNGETLTAERFEEIFTVEETTVTDPNGTVHTASRVFIPAASDWKLGALSASDISSTNATIATDVASAGTDPFAVYGAYSADAIDEAYVLTNGVAVAEADGAYARTLSGLTENTVYHYAFAIVTNGAVAAYKSGVFVASDYAYVYDEGWIGGIEPAALNTEANRVLFLSDYTTLGEVNLGGKCFRDSVFTSGTLLFGTAEVINAGLVNVRNYTLNQTPYGIYAAAYALNFTSQSGDGTVRRACSYNFRATTNQLETFYTTVIESGMIRHNGETITAENYAALFSLDEVGTEAGSYDYADGEGAVETTMTVSTLTLWDVIPSNASGDWTLLDGARARLVGRTRLNALTVVSADGKIDLNGQNLRVKSLVVAGQKLTGSFTAATLPDVLVGEGKLDVAYGATVIMLK